MFYQLYERRRNRKFITKISQFQFLSGENVSSWQVLNVFISHYSIGIIFYWIVCVHVGLLQHHHHHESNHTGAYFVDTTAIVNVVVVFIAPFTIVILTKLTLGQCRHFCANFDINPSSFLVANFLLWFHVCLCFVKQPTFYCKCVWVNEFILF